MTKRSRLAAVLALLVIASAIGGATGARAQSTATPAWPITGLYLTNDVAAHVAGSGLALISTLKCSALLDILAAGEWTMTERDQAVDFSGNATGETWAVLRRGTSAALVKARDDGGCEARIDPLGTAKVTASGATSAKETALAYPLGCVETDDSTHAWQIVVGFEGQKQFRAMVILNFTVAKGDQPLAAETTAAAAGETSKSLLASWFAVEKGHASQSMAGVPVSIFQAGGGFSGTATVATINPPSGSFSLQGLASQDGAAESISGSFACPAA